MTPKKTAEEFLKSLDEADEALRQGKTKNLSEVIKELDEEYAKKTGLTVKQVRTLGNTLADAFMRGATEQECRALEEKLIKQFKNQGNAVQPKKSNPKPKI